VPEAVWGPDWPGAAGRFSRDDLFVAIALPNRQTSRRDIRRCLIETKAGKTYTGMIVYEAADGLLLRMASIRRSALKPATSNRGGAFRRPSLPEGLLKDLADEDLADL